MFKNYLKVALRNILRHRGYAFINIAGLAAGMAVCILIFVWVRYQFSYDKFHENLTDLYWVCTSDYYGSQVSYNRGCPPAVSPALKEEYPEVVRASRYMRWEGLLKYGDKHFREQVRFIDPDFLEMFTIPFVKGDPLTALLNQESIVISERAAEKYFETEDPIGKIMCLNNQVDLEVTGIFKDWPENSTFGHDYFIPIPVVTEFTREEYISTWYNCSFFNFVQLQEGTKFEEFNARIADRIKQSHPESKLELYLFPFKKIHLHWISGEGGMIETVKTYSIIALAVLIIAAINFINLMTARSGRRAKEVGMRKVVGANRAELIRQFYFESIFHAFLAAILAIGLVEVLLPTFRTLMNETGIRMEYFNNPTILLGIIVIAMLTGILSGSYPALLLSAFKPVKIFKGATVIETRKSWFRRILVIFQFAISIIMIVSTLVIYQQQVFMKNKDLGFDREQLVYFPLNDQISAGYEGLKSELLQNANILSVTRSSHSPSGIYWNGWGWDWEGRDPNDDPLITYLGVSNDYLATFGMEMAQGEFYAPDMMGRETDGIVINETFAKLMELDPIIGQRLSYDGKNYRVMGIVKDFHYKPVTGSIGPLVMIPEPTRRHWYLFARIHSDHVAETVEFMAQRWKEFSPNFPFEYHFLDEDYEYFYYAEKATGNTLRFFSFLAVFISCLGLFGLSAFAAEQRTKEIGIRKVLGATVTNIIKLLSREFLGLVLVANVIALPIAVYLMKDWLQGYAYRVDLNVSLFVLAGSGALLIALFTVSFQAIKAALSNPVKSLRYE